MNDVPLIRPDWPAPVRVRAVTTTRLGGVSSGRFESLNLGAGVPDAPQDIDENRRRLSAAAGLPAEPCWLKQVHGQRVVDAGAQTGSPPDADAAIARRAGAVCAVLTADCLPVAFCDRFGSRVGIAHAGWRGLAAGVLENTVSRGSWLIVELRDHRAGSGNHRGLGSRIRLSGGDAVQTRWIYSGGAFQSANAPAAHFALSSPDPAAVITVDWPDGFEQRVEDVTFGQVLVVERPVGPGAPR